MINLRRIVIASTIISRLLLALRVNFFAALDAVRQHRYGELVQSYAMEEKTGQTSENQ